MKAIIMRASTKNKPVTLKKALGIIVFSLSVFAWGIVPQNSIAQQNIPNTQDLFLLCYGQGSTILVDDGAEYSFGNSSLRVRQQSGVLRIYEGTDLVLELDDFTQEGANECLRILTGSSAEVVEVPPTYDYTTFDLAQVQRLYEDEVWAANFAFSNEGEWLAVAVDVDGDSMVWIYQTSDWSVSVQLESSWAGAVNAMSFTEDGRYLVLSAGGDIEVFEVFDDWRRRTISGPSGDARDIGFIPGVPTAGFATFGNGEFCRVDLRNSQLGACYQNGGDATNTPQSIWALAVAHSGDEIATGDAYGVVRRWDIRNLDEPLHSYPAERGWIFDLAFSQDGASLFAAVDDHEVVVWALDGDNRRGLIGDQAFNEPQFEFSNNTSDIFVLHNLTRTFIEGYDVASGAKNFTIRETTILDGEELGATFGMAMSNDGRYLAFGAYNLVVAEFTER